MNSSGAHPTPPSDLDLSTVQSDTSERSAETEQVLAPLSEDLQTVSDLLTYKSPCSTMYIPVSHVLTCNSCTYLKVTHCT